MKVFVTGASGFVGTAVVRELIKSGHQVLGLARSDASATQLEAVGAEVQRGSLDDVKSLETGAAQSDGVIHLAFGHDFSKFAENCEIDRRTIGTLGAVLAGTDRPLVVTSGILLLPSGKINTEQETAATTPGSLAALRGQSEAAALSLAREGVRVSVVRLPPSVHGEGDKGFVPTIIHTARTKGESSYVGDGLNRWTSVHVLDAARLYVLALESAPAGTTLHAVADEGIPFCDLTATIGKALNVPVTSKSSGEAGEHFGVLAPMLSLDNPATSTWTQSLLGWKPVQPGLLEDIKKPHYILGSKTSFN